jgi:hypothetical protein
MAYELSNASDLAAVKSALHLPVYLPERYGAVGNGTTNDTAAFTSLAAAVPNGARVLIRGTYALSSQVTFAQTDLEVIFEGDAWIKQADGTQSLDNLVTFSGARCRFYNMGIDGNAFGTIASPNTGHGNTSYTGRGEVVILTGDYCSIYGLRVKRTAKDDAAKGASNVSCGLVVRGNYCSVYDIWSENTGLVVIRNRGHYNTYRRGNMTEWEVKAIAHDGDSVVGAQAGFVKIEGIYAKTSSTTAREAIMADPGVGNALALFEVSDCHMDMSAATSGSSVDVTKAVYCDAAIYRRCKIVHGSTTISASIRIQEGVSRVVIDGCEMDGGINFDPTVKCDMLITGRSRMGLASTAAQLIWDFWGTLRVDDGCEVKGYSAFFVTVYAPNAATAAVSWADTNIDIGSLIYDPGNSAAKLVNTSNLGGSGSNYTYPRAGQIKVAPPIIVRSGKGPSDGVWVTNQESHEVAVQLGGHVARQFTGTSANLPASGNIDGWYRGDRVSRRDATASAVAEVFITSAGSSCTTAFTSGEAVTTGTRRSANSKVYQATNSGTTGVTTPSHSSGTASDGTVTWQYVAALAVAKTGITLAA